jgi:predicted nucleic acid-binding protein
VALLDTTFLIDLMKETKRRRPGRATAKLAELTQRGELLRVSLFSLGELYVGVAKCNQPIREEKAIDECLRAFEIVNFDWTTARTFGLIVGGLERQGRPPSDMDALIAATAIDLDELLVTRNLQDFVRIPGLRVESY